MCVDNKFNKPFKSYLGEGYFAVFNFVDSMIKESKSCSNVMKKHFNNELVVTKEDDEDFQNPTTCRIFDNVHIDDNVKVRDHFHITGNIEALHIKYVISRLN